MSLQQKQQLKLEVCMGKDCSCSGGNAALLEIEELVSEYHFCQTDREKNEKNDNNNPNNLSLELFLDKNSGCRNFCTIGPNAHLLKQQQRRQRRRSHGGSDSDSESESDSDDSNTKEIIIQSFHGVDSTERCEEVVKAAFETINMNNNKERLFSCNTTNNNKTISIMRKRSNRIRWNSLRNISRYILEEQKDRRKKKRRKNDNTIVAIDKNTNSNATNAAFVLTEKQKERMHSCRIEIERIYNSEIAASTKNKDRAQRRMQRLQNRIDMVFLSDDNDS